MSIKSFRKTCVVVLSVVALFFYANVFASDPVNINQADANQLAEQLKGVGPSKAEAIVKYREQFGPFEKIEDLVNVKGIGPGVLSKNKEVLSLSSP